MKGVQIKRLMGSMVSGYERQFTAAGAEIEEETQRVNRNLSSLSAFPLRSPRRRR